MSYLFLVNIRQSSELFFLTDIQYIMSYAETSESAWHSVALDKNSCLNLQQILEVFSAPISEEQAWAVLYQVFSTLIKG